MRVANHAKAYASSSFWWTIGGEGFRPLALSARNMPDPFLFTEMLTGRFSFGFD
jgi:type VI secretion system protein ImpM